MGKNKKENFIFTLICCALMVLGMASYNGILRNGFTNNLISDILISYIPIFCIAIIIDWFFIGRIAKSIVSKIVQANDPLIKKVLLTSSFMVIGMCFCMSLITSIITIGVVSTEFPLEFIKALGRNFIFALPLQLIIVGPIARSIFFKMYPAN